MNGYFVTGTGTDVGKTVLSALLCLALDAHYFKPFQTGPDADADTVARLTGLDASRIHPSAVRLSAPLSPNQAAGLEGVALDIASIRLPATSRALIVEGAGGALVPIAPGQDMAALMARLGLPVIVAAHSGLGTINHTRLTLEALAARGVEVAGVALLGEPNAANRRDIERLGGVPVILELPRLDPLTRESLAAFVPALKLPGRTALAGSGEGADAGSATTAGGRSPDGAIPTASPGGPGIAPHSPDSPPDVVAMDRAHVWHPFTQAAAAPAPVQIVRGRGAKLHTAEGRELLDLVSSWWVNPHGHAHPAIASAIARQAARLEQVIFADFTHEPAARLAHELARLLPGGLTRVFYSDNGSTAVEAAVKMAHQYWRNQGRPERARFAAFNGGYHGDTAGAMSVGLSSGFYKGFEPLTFKVDFLPYPATWLDDPDIEERERNALAVIGNYFAVHAGCVAALVIEPLVQGASGMRMARPGFVRKVSELARQAGALVIYDEVMTGFGRTGTMFACERIGFTPDIICLAKGLTAGFLPMAATVATDAIYEGFRGQTFDRALAHGHSFTGNPLGCAAALAGLTLFEEEAALARIAALEAVHAKRLSALSGHPGVARPRWLGSIGAADVTLGESGYGASIGVQIKEFFLARGLYARPLGDVFYILPPYCLTPDDLNLAYDTLGEALAHLGQS
jgi:adenosylmethionine-8-amino-7-oxononanoate aminotransferase